jgi:protein FRG1
MVKPLSFKGDKKPKKRKRTADTEGELEAVVEKELALSRSGGDPTIEDENSWVTAETSGDIVGPIVFVLPSEPPTCIACDTNGKVFASALENIIDGDLSTAEPHDVRQVWVANRLTGTEKLSFKGYHAK